MTVLGYSHWVFGIVVLFFVLLNSSLSLFWSLGSSFLDSGDPKCVIHIPHVPDPPHRGSHEVQVDPMEHVQHLA